MSPYDGIDSYCRRDSKCKDPEVGANLNVFGKKEDSVELECDPGRGEPISQKYSAIVYNCKLAKCLIIKVKISKLSGIYFVDKE